MAENGTVSKIHYVLASGNLILCGPILSQDVKDVTDDIRLPECDALRAVISDLGKSLRAAKEVMKSIFCSD